MENTGVMQEIEELLAQGYSSRQVIDWGYAPGTVYGVQRRIRRQLSKQENNGAHNQATEQSADITPLIEEIVERMDRFEERLDTITLARDETEDIAQEHVNELTHQVNDIAGQLEGLPERCEQLEAACHQLEEAHNSLAETVNQNNEAAHKQFAIDSDRAKTMDARLRQLEALTHRLGEKIEAHSANVSQLVNRMNPTDQKMAHIEAELQTLKKRLLRQPTGEVVSVQLNDKRDHRFKEYKSMAGLVQPHRISRDIIFGDRWIDLAEPVD